MITVYVVLVNNQIMFESIDKDERDDYYVNFYANNESDMIKDQYNYEPLDHRKHKK